MHPVMASRTCRHRSGRRNAKNLLRCSNKTSFWTLEPGPVAKKRQNFGVLSDCGRQLSFPKRTIRYIWQSETSCLLTDFTRDALLYESNCPESVALTHLLVYIPSTCLCSVALLRLSSDLMDSNKVTRRWQLITKTS